MAVKYYRHPPPEANQQWLPDYGELSNPGWLEAVNVVPYAEGWLIGAPLTERTQLATVDVRGFATHPSNGTNDWKVYYGTKSRLYEVEPATWPSVGTDRTEYVAVGQGWQEDNSGGPSYVDITTALNSAAPSDAQPFPAGAGANDAVYFGFADPISVLVVVVGTAGAGLYSVTWEYWDGSSWTALSGVTDGTSGFKSTGSADVEFTFPTDWAATTVNGSSSLFFLRARRDANTVTTDPLLTSATASTASADGLTAWQFLPYGNHMVAAGGQNHEAKIRLDDAGDFVDLVTNAEPVISGGAASGNWPPKPKFVAQWGLALVMANIRDTGPADAFDDASGVNDSLLWISDSTGRIWSIVEEDDGAGGTTYNSHRSTFKYLNDEHGKITALAGGEEFGVVGKATAVYRATYPTAFRADVDVASAQVGWVFPNAGAWGPNHEFYFWSTAGPAVMTHSGVQVLGIGRWQRTLFDPTYVTDTYNMNTDQSAPYLLFCEYSKATDIVTWYYRRDQDTPDMALHYHRGTGRASIQDLKQLRDSGGVWSATVLGAAAIPYSEVSEFTGSKDILVVSKDSGGNAHIYQPATTGAVKWNGKPTLTSGYLELTPFGKTTVLRARPRYSLNTGTSGPQVTVTLDSKHLAAGDAAATNQKSSSTVNAATGMVHLTGAISAAYNRVKMELGNATLDNVENVAEIEGYDLVHDDPGEPL